MLSIVLAGCASGPDLATASPDLVLETLANDAGDRYLARQFLVFFDDAHLLLFDRPRVLEALRSNAEALAAEGAIGLSTSCGFLALYQNDLERLSPVPVATSSTFSSPRR